MVVPIINLLENLQNPLAVVPSPGKIPMTNSTISPKQSTKISVSVRNWSAPTTSFCVSNNTFSTLSTTRRISLTKSVTSNNRLINFVVNMLCNPQYMAEKAMNFSLTWRRTPRCASMVIMMQRVSKLLLIGTQLIRSKMMRKVKR